MKARTLHFSILGGIALLIVIAALAWKQRDDDKRACAAAIYEAVKLNDSVEDVNAALSESPHAQRVCAGFELGEIVVPK